MKMKKMGGSGPNKVQAKGLSNTHGSSMFTGGMRKESSNVKSNTVGKIKKVKVTKMH